MKRVYMFAVMALMMLSMIGFASAYTVIAGKVYNIDTDGNNVNIIPNATVIVNCTHSAVITSITNITDETGSYAVKFASDNCILGDALYALAKAPDGRTGSDTGTVSLDMPTDSLDIGIVNVFILIPEFGLIAGLTAIIGALGIFFVVRKK